MADQVVEELSPAWTLDNGVLRRTQLARLLREAAGWTARDWIAQEAEGREEVHWLGLFRLIKAGGVPVTRWWQQMEPNSPERAAVLLAGAEVLGIETDWPGWPSVTA